MYKLTTTPLFPPPSAGWMSRGSPVLTPPPATPPVGSRVEGARPQLTVEGGKWWKWEDRRSEEGGGAPPTPSDLEIYMCKMNKNNYSNTLTNEASNIQTTHKYMHPYTCKYIYTPPTRIVYNPLFSAHGLNARNCTAIWKGPSLRASSEGGGVGVGIVTIGRGFPFRSVNSSNPAVWKYAKRERETPYLVSAVEWSRLAVTPRCLTSMAAAGWVSSARVSSFVTASLEVSLTASFFERVGECC